MTTLDDEIQIEVVRKEEVAEVPVYFKVDGHPTANISYPKYQKTFNWRDVEGGNCTELLKSLEGGFGLVLDNPTCSTLYPDPNMGIDITIWIVDPTYEVYLDMEKDMEHVALFIRKWVEEEDYTYHQLCTGKICGYDDLDIFLKGKDADRTLPTEITLPIKSIQEFKIYLGNTRAIDFELGITKEGFVNCGKVWGFDNWCTRTMAPKVEVTDNSVNILIDPIAITSNEILTILQDRGKIDIEKLPPALQSGTCGWTSQGGDVVPLGSLSSDTKLRYTAPWLLYGQPSIPPLTFTIDLVYGNPPASAAAIDLHLVGDGTIPYAPIIRASLDELPIVGGQQKIRIPITFAILSKTDDLTKEIEGALSFVNENTPESVSFISEVVHFNEATDFTYREYNDKRCSSLEAWNVRNMGYEEGLPKYCIGYYLLWKHLLSDEPCVGGEASWPPAGINRRSTASTAYNVWWWSEPFPGTSMSYGTTTLVHELHHMFALTLDDEGYYPQSYTLETHQYGKTIPFIDSMNCFGFSDEYEWTRWCYSQLTYDMCKKLSEIAASEPHPPIVIDQCILTFTTPGYNVTVEGKEYETPIEIPTSITSIETEQGTVYEAKEDVLIKTQRKECNTTISAFRMVGDLWALDETAASGCFFDILEKYTGSASRLVIRLKDIEEIEEEKTEAKFVRFLDPITGDETVEVHPYIMVVPGGVSPVVNAIVNTGDESIAVDMWEVFGGIELLPHRTPVIPVGEAINFDYMTTRPDLPLGQYECTFYLGQHDKGIIYDEFTQPAIIIVDHFIDAKSTELTIPTHVHPGQTHTGVLCVDVLSIRGAKSAFADLWVCKDGDKTWEKMKEVGMTIVDRRLWPLMEETRIGLTRTETLYPSNHYCLEFEFTVPSDWTPGTYELDLYFGKWDKYFTYWGSVTRFFTVEVTEATEVNGTINIPASDIPSFLYQQTPSAFDMAVINTGTAKAEYQIAITFEGVDVANEEVFWSDWSGDVAPNESVMIPIPVELSEEAIPEGAETAEYIIDTKLVAR